MGSNNDNNHSKKTHKQGACMKKTGGGLAILFG